MESPFANGPGDLEPVTDTVAEPTVFMNYFIAPRTIRMPAHIEQEFRRYLECGISALGPNPD